MSVLRCIARFTITSSTPLLIGGFDGAACRDIGGQTVCEGVRSQSVKGLWRWFLRSLIAGVLYSSGYTSKEIEVKTVELIGKLLGYVKGGYSQPSKIRLVVFTDRDEACDFNIIRTLRDHQRVRLLQLGDKDEKFILNEYTCRFIRSATIALYPRPGVNLSDVEENLAVSSLLLSFLLGCLGKGSRRGLGCFDIRIRYNDYLPPSIRKIGITEYLVRGESPSRDTLASLISFAWKVAARYVGVPLSLKQSEKLPPVPSIAPGAFKLFRISHKNPLEKDPLKIAVTFSKAVTRSERALRLLKIDYMRDPLYLERLAWILGLPRSQKGTGYYKIQDEKGVELQRRASPFILAVHREYALLSVFYSLDWPAYIKWKGSSSCEVHIERSTGEVLIRMGSSVSRQSIRELIDYALGVLLDAMKNQGYEVEEVHITW